VRSAARRRPRLRRSFARGGYSGRVPRVPRHGARFRHLGRGARRGQAGHRRGKRGAQRSLWHGEGLSVVTAEVQSPDAQPATALDVREALRLMLTIRHFDERALALYRAGEMRGTTHPYIGMEAVGVGVTLALRPDDYVTSTHRGHGHTIAKGGDPKKMMAELLGRATGYSGGKGGSMHIADMDK